MDLTLLLRTEVARPMWVGLAIGLFLLLAKPKDRDSTRNALVLLGMAAAALAVSAMLRHYQVAPAAAGILADLAAIASGIALIRLGGILFFRALLPLVRVNPARIVEDLVTIALVFAWGIVWLRLTGVDLGSVVATSAVITGVIAFSMQETLGNILGGVILQLDQSIRVGDWVKLEDTSGVVVEVRWRHTSIETRNRETIVIPNGWLMKNRFTIIGSRADPRPIWRRWLWFDLDIAHPPTRVCEVLVKALTDADIPHVARDPAPSAVLMRVEFGIGRYALRYFLTDPRPDDITDSIVRAHALAALKRHDLPIAPPREERLMLKENEASRAAEHARELVQRKAALARVDLFSSLSDDERAELAEHLVYAPFVTGDTVTRQGAVAHWLYLVVKGEADVWAEEGGERTHVSTITAGSVFGEMGMMTGEPRRATITARTDLECYRLDKAGFERVLHTRPDIAREMSQILAMREAERLGRLGTLSGAGKRGGRDADLLARIRSFFGLSG